MATGIQVEDLLKLDTHERLRLIEALWESLASHPEQVSVTDAQRRVIDERLREHEAQPDDVMSWDELKAGLQLR